MSDKKEEFLELFRQNVTRRGADKLLEWLESTDFSPHPHPPGFTRPTRAVCLNIA